MDLSQLKADFSEKARKGDGAFAIALAIVCLAIEVEGVGETI